MFFAFRSLTAASMSSTSMQTWWIPPDEFFLRKPEMGDLSPSGCSSSILIPERRIEIHNKSSSVRKCFVFRQISRFRLEIKY